VVRARGGQSHGRTRTDIVFLQLKRRVDMMEGFLWRYEVLGQVEEKRMTVGLSRPCECGVGSAHSGPSRVPSSLSSRGKGTPS
jgi:hypothetical protein